MAAYRISVTSGHLTAANKRDISHMLANGMTNGRTRAGIAYALAMDEGAPDAWHVRIVKSERDDWGRPVERAHRAAFTAKATP